MGRKIDILCNDGSPLNITQKDIYGEGANGRIGVGGAELALLTMCAGWQFYGNKVTLYNNPNVGGASDFEQKTLDEFDPAAERDILIVFRSPNTRAMNAKGKRIWWSCDQYTVGNFAQWAPWAEKIVTISPHHSAYFRATYGIYNTQYIDLPIRTWDYDKKAEKIKNRCIFTSMPDRGLMPLHAAWARIVNAVPDASLVITSDWRLWSEHADQFATNPYRVAFAQLPNVTYRGALPRKALVEIQQQAELHLYPCTYEELFCISVAESQVAGAFPITSDYGALKTTNMGLWLHGNPSMPDFIDLFVDKTIEQMRNPEIAQKNREYVQEVAMKRFALENIINKWEKVFDE